MEELLGPNLYISHFLCTYLGLHLHYKKLPKSTIQPMAQRIGNQLSGWKRNLLTYPGRELLVQMGDQECTSVEKETYGRVVTLTN
jgi:hypothetical protein